MSGIPLERTYEKGVYDAHRLVTSQMQAQYVAMQGTSYGSPTYIAAQAKFDALNVAATELMGLLRSMDI